MKNKYYLLYIIPFLIFYLAVIKSHFFNNDKQILFEEPLSFKVFKSRNYKGQLILNDSVSVFGGCKRVFPNQKKHFYLDYYKTLKSIKPPYLLSKKANNDTILVTIGLENYYYDLNSFEDDSQLKWATY